MALLGKKKVVADPIVPVVTTDTTKDLNDPRA